MRSPLNSSSRCTAVQSTRAPHSHPCWNRQLDAPLAPTPRVKRNFGLTSESTYFLLLTVAPDFLTNFQRTSHQDLGLQVLQGARRKLCCFDSAAGGLLMPAITSASSAAASWPIQTFEAPPSSSTSIRVGVACTFT